MAKATLIIDAKMNIAQLEGAIGKIKNGLNGLKLPKNLEGQFTKNFTKLESLIQEFKGFQGVTLNKKESQQMMKISSAISSQWRNISVMLKDFADINNIDLSKIGLKEVATQLDKVTQAQEKYNQARNKAKQSKEYLDNQEQINTYEEKLKSAKRNRASKSEKLDTYKAIKINEQANLKVAEESIQKYQEINNKLEEAIEKKKDLEKQFTDSKELQSKLPLNQKGQPLSERSLKGKITKLGKNLATLSSNSIIKNQLKDKNLWDFDINSLEELSSAAINKKYQKNDLKEQVASLREYIELRKQLQLLQNSNDLKDSDKISEELKNQEKLIESLQKEKEVLEKDQNDAKKTIKENSTLDNNIDKKEKEIAALDANINLYTQKLENLKQIANNIITTGTTDSWTRLKQVLSEIGVEVDDLTQDASGFKKITERVGQVGTQEFEKLNQVLEDINKNAEKGGKAVKDIGEQGKAYENTFKAQTQFDAEVDSMRNRIQYFFGLNNAINLFQRGIRQAYETVKELDNAMTETAVVTDFSVGDMWEQLPRYTEAANELGATTLGAYETMTLFYQQGLNTDQTFALGTETMKMARIANLDYANATNLMTAALRGFNMELNEVSAKKVNDVYSKLAAITAADTQEIASAMTKTASIANSANMEFETTAAFLSQIIETTRESAETAGTAMKTIVARFTEVKKLGQSGSIMGKDSEGEVININKIDAALKTIGMSLSGFISGEQGLDDILLELASKWDSLDIATQRYIATTAAGSRQQSRFLAMMSDYGRTLELVNAAENSAGAGEDQFAKTQDSLKSKLNALSNAWNEFTMGLANNKVFKVAIDGLTNILNLINKITSIPGGGLLKIGIAASLLRGGGTLAQTGVNWLAGTLTGAGPDIKDAVGKTLSRSGAENSSFKSLLWKQFSGPWTLPFEAFKAFKNGEQEDSGTSGKRGQKLYQIGDKAYGFLHKGTGKHEKIKPGLLNTKLASALKLKGNTGLRAATGLLGLGGVIAGVTAGAIGLGVALKAAYDLSPAGQLKAAKALTKSFDEAAASSRQFYKSQKENYQKYQKAREKIDNSTNLKDKEQNVLDNNKIVISMLEADSSLMNNITNKNGQLEFKDTSVVNESLNKLEEKQDELSASSNLGKALIARLEAQKYTTDSNLLKLGQVYTVPGGVEVIEPTEKDLVKAEKYTNEAEVKTFEAEAFEQQAFNDMLSKDLRGSELGGQIATAVSESIDFDTELGAFEGRNIFETKAEAARKYKEYFGVEATDLDIKEIQKRNKMYEVSKDFMEDEGNLVKDLEAISSSDIGKDLIAFASGNFTGNLDNFIEKIKPGTAEMDVLEKIAAVQGKENYEDYVQAQRQVIEETRQANKVKIVETMADLGLGALGSTDTNTILQNNAMAKTLLANTTVEQQQQLSNLIDRTSGLGDKGQLALFKNINNLFGTANSEAVMDWINNIDFSNPIKAVQELKKASESSIPEIRDIGKSLLESGSDAFTASNQFKYFLTSADFAEIDGDLKELVETNGKIDANNILELADDCEALEVIMDETGATAAGLAEILTLFEKGDIGFNQITDSVLAAASAFDSLDSVSAAALKDIKDFDPGMDENEVAENLGKVNDLVKENLEKGAYGNTQLNNYLKHYFGEEAFQLNGEALTGDALIAKQQQLANILDANKENMYSAWSNLAQGQNMFGNTYAGNALAGDKGTGNLRIAENNGEIEIEGYENFSSTDALVKAIMKASGGTEAWATAMITDFKNYSPDAAEYFRTADAEIASEAFIKAGKGFFDKTEIQAYGEMFGEAAEESLRKSIEKDGGIITEFYNEDGTQKEGEALYDEIKNAYTGTDFSTAFNISGEDIISLDSLESYFSQIHLPENMWGEATQSYVDSLQAANEESVQQLQKTYKGIPIQFEVEKGQTIEQAYELAVDEYKYEQQAEAIKEAFADVTSEVTVNRPSNGTLASLGVQIHNAVQSGITPVHQSVIVDTPKSSAGGIISKVVGKLTGNVAKGGLVASYANGTNKVKPGLALTGEEDPEIIWNKDKGYAYLAGANGPEYNDLIAGDRVFDAEETKKILQNSRRNNRPALSKGGYVNSYGNGAHGYGGANKDGGSGGSGGGKNSDKDKGNEWRNEFDWLYNLMEDIVELERDQEKYNKIYERLLADQNSTGRDLVSLTRKQLTNLYEQERNQKVAYEKRLFEAQEYLDKNKQFSEYGTYNFEDQTVEIDWDKIEAIQDEELYKDVKEYVDGLEAVQDKIDTADDALYEIEEQIRELQDKFEQDYIDFEDRVLNALVDSYQKQIDKQDRISNTIRDTNADLLNSVQKALDKQRQDRENKETEDNLSEKERRLAYLKQDTSTNNLIEIKELEEELAQERQDYTDQLIDQKLTELQDQEDYAAQQREREIELMQSQLEYAKASGDLWHKVHDLMNQAIDPSGKLINNSSLVELLKDSENWQSLSAVGAKVWQEKFEESFKKMVAFQEMGSSIGSEDKDKTITFLDKDGNVLDGTVNENGKVRIKDKEGKEWLYSGFEWDDKKGMWVTKQDREKYVAPKVETPEHSQPADKYTPDSGHGGGGGAGGSGGGYVPSDPAPTTPSSYTASARYVYYRHSKGSVYGTTQVIQYTASTYAEASRIAQLRAKSLQENTYKAARQQADAWNKAHRGKSLAQNKNQSFTVNKTGGLADYTGFAWMDGTPSKPELVLNARDTENFIQLKDILSGILKNDNSESNFSNGDNYYDIHIDATLANDYDVERLTEKIKKEITKDASYRNVNVINRRR